MRNLEFKIFFKSGSSDGNDYLQWPDSISRDSWGDLFAVMPIEIHQWRATIGCFFLPMQRLDISNLNAKTLCELLLYGTPRLSIIDNRIILEANISFIEPTKRLN